MSAVPASTIAAADPPVLATVEFPVRREYAVAPSGAPRLTNGANRPGRRVSQQIPTPANRQVGSFGTKRAQVQILSPRPVFTQVAALPGDRGGPLLSALGTNQSGRSEPKLPSPDSLLSMGAVIFNGKSYELADLVVDQLKTGLMESLGVV